MAQATQKFRQLARLYATIDIEFNNLKSVTFAQWILESGRGNSGLAQQHNNFAGIKYRPEMEGFARAVEYEANDGPDTYCAFEDLTAFVDGYWHFLERRPYVGWRSQVQSPSDFMYHIGARWSGSDGDAYAERVFNLVGEARLLLQNRGESGVPIGGGGGGQPPFDPQPGDDGGLGFTPKPAIKAFYRTRNQSARDGQAIRRVILHYTNTRTAGSVVNTFQNANSSNPVSAHYIVARNGDIFQMVEEAQKAWHCRGANDDSIGIEIVALPGERIAPAQNNSVVALVRYLMGAYGLTADDITGHKFADGYTGATPCPAALFGEPTYDAMRDWIEANFR